MVEEVCRLLIKGGMGNNADGALFSLAKRW